MVVAHERPVPAPSRTTSSRRRWCAATAAIVGLLAGFEIWNAPSAIFAPWDVFALLDGGYRITEGQSYGRDFSDPVGPLVYALVAVGMHLQHVPSLASVAYGNTVFLVGMAVAAWRASAGRLPPVATAAFTVYVALLIAPPRPLGYGVGTFSYAMLYNRYGWVLFMTVAVLTLARAPGDAILRRSDGVLLGLLLGLAFFCKITFFVAAVVVTVAAIALRTMRVRRDVVAGAAAAFAAVALVMWSAFHVSVTGYLTDLRTAASVQSTGRRRTALDLVLNDNRWAIALSLVLIAGFLGWARTTLPPRTALVPATAAVLVLAASVVLSGGDAPEHADVPGLLLVPVVLLVTAGLVRTGATTSLALRTGPGRAVLAVDLVAVLLLVLNGGRIASEDVRSLAGSESLHSTVQHPPATQRLDAARLRDFVIPADSQWPTAYRVAHDVPAMIDDGLALLRSNVRAHDTVTTLAFTDPFSFALDLPSNRGALWWDLNFDFDRKVFVSPRREFGRARWVMIPRAAPGQGCCEDVLTTLLGIYAPYLSAHFAMRAETSDWILLERRS